MNDLLQYWRNPNDGLNEPMMYIRPRNWYRSIHLFSIISDLIPPQDNPNILEIGTNIGRNLMMLRFGNYTNLSGIELSENAVRLMREVFPLSSKFEIYIGEVEKLIYLMQSSYFDIVFTMAVLEHLPHSSDHVFSQIARTTKKYLITIEDEKRYGDRHFLRKYHNVFEPLGLKQIRVIKHIEGLTKNFVCRIFFKE